ncbi:MAG: GlsB/YeaQ/YmgE family stress response membrane protein [Hyphomicrobium sp.]|uniref:GlsB/YeaQ/YmgE family stress response membrane protein n=1 Tax=Hyphomicrobium sp. TaxID=82 RepID=UPI0035695BF0
MPTLDQFIVWIVIGLIGGALAGSLSTWSKEGYGRAKNFVLGLAGALIGGFLFRILGLFPDLDRYAISLRDVIAAVIGSLIVLAAIWYYQRSALP